MPSGLPKKEWHPDEDFPLGDSSAVTRPAYVHLNCCEGNRAVILSTLRIRSVLVFLLQSALGPSSLLRCRIQPYCTVKIALLLVTLPARLLTVTAKSAPLSPAVVG